MADRPPLSTFEEQGLAKLSQRPSLESFDTSIKTAPEDRPIAQRASAFGGILEGLPMVGPAIKGAGQYTAAGLRSLTSGQPFSKELEAVQNISRGVEREHPTAHMLGEIGGAVAGGTVLGAAAPSAFGIGASTLPRAVGQAALGGGSIGAVDALARGQNPLTGAAVGMGAGAAGPLIGAGASRVVSPMIETARNYFQPGSQAARQIIESMTQGRPGLTGPQFAAARQAGAPVSNIELGGAPTRALARYASNISPEAHATLAEHLGDRFRTQGTRVGTQLEGVLNFPGQNVQQALEQIARNVNSQAYQRAYQAGARGMWSDKLEQLSGSDAVNKAMRSAASAYRDEAIVSGRGALEPPVQFAPDGSMHFTRNVQGVPVYPDLKYWDLVRRELGDASFRAGRGTEEARRLGTFASELNRELDRIVPEYREARQGAAAFFGAQNALEAGQKAVTLTKMGNTQLQTAINKFAPMEKQLFQDGYAQKLIDRALNTPDQTNIVRRMFGSPKQRERIEIALGAQKAHQIEAMIQVEHVMNLARDAVQGNSSTARQLAQLQQHAQIGPLGQLGLAGFAGEAAHQGINLMLGHSGGWAGLLAAAMTYGGLQAKTLSKQGQIKVANDIARMLVSNNPGELQRGLTLLSTNKGMMAAMRKATEAMATAARTGGETTAIQQIPQMRMPQRQLTYGGPQE